MKKEHKTPRGCVPTADREVTAAGGWQNGAGCAMMGANTARRGKRRRGMRILVVEDEADLNLLLCKVLTRAGYTVDGCMDGEEAELHLMGAEYDGILLDVMLPKKDGYTLVQELRAKGADTPVLFLTARDSVADRVRGLDLGGDDYLVKPFDFDELLARIRAMTRTQTVQPDAQFQLGNVTLNRATFVLSSPTGSFRLSNKEFQMMELLMANPRSLISSERFLEKIWGYDSETEINVVWVISPICGKSSPLFTPMSKSRPCATPDILWRKCHDWKAACKADLCRYGLLAFGACGDFRHCWDPELSKDCRRCGQHSLPAPIQRR